MTDASALLLVTNSSMPSVARTVAGMVTRAVGWLNAAWADARNEMVSAALAGDAPTTPTASDAATTASEVPATDPRRPSRLARFRTFMTHSSASGGSPGRESHTHPGMAQPDMTAPRLKKEAPLLRSSVRVNCADRTWPVRVISGIRRNLTEWTGLCGRIGHRAGS